MTLPSPPYYALNKQKQFVVVILHKNHKEPSRRFIYNNNIYVNNPCMDLFSFHLADNLPFSRFCSKFFFEISQEKTKTKF